MRRRPSDLLATILVVDDVASHRGFLVTLLRQHGHRVLEAANGQEGLVAVQGELPDLVITDVLMPVMDGYEFVRQLRLEPATSKLPVLFYTAPYCEPEARALARSSGGHEVLRKPADPDNVLAVVARVLAGESGPATSLDTAPQTVLSNGAHLRLLSAKLSEKFADLRTGNVRLRALINIGLEIAARPNADGLLQSVCAAAQDLFGATYTTLGIVDRNDGTVCQVITCGLDAKAWIQKGDPVPGVLGAVVAEGRLLRGDNRGANPANPRFPALHPEVQAFLAAPIASPGRVYGWICLVGNEGRDFSDDDAELILALSGQVGRIYELDHEVLERRQAEASLRQERDRSQRYLDTAEVILLALDPEGRITLVNRYACSVFGWTEAELLGQDFIDTCVAAPIRDETRDKLGKVLTGPDSSVVDNAIITKAGEERLIEWRNTLLRDDEGRVISTLSSGTDITGRTQSADALRTAEERMRFALEAAGVGIWDINYTTGVLRWSGILESQYGLKPGTFAGTIEAFLERVHPEDRDALVATLTEANRSGTDFSVQHRALWPDGTVRWLSGAGRIHLGEHGEPVRGIGISLDITARHSLEMQFQQAQKMEAIGRLAGGVAHDFNNLLTTILGYCELLLGDLAIGDPRQADIEEIQKAGQSAAGLTRQLLAFSRKEIIELKLLDLNAVVTNVRVMLARLIGEDIRIVLALRPDLARVKADWTQVEQIVLNLAVNARDAMPHGGTLTIETSNVELDEFYARTHISVTPGPYVALMVTDTGTGMSPEIQARLFEPFFTTKEPGKGTGLGLATVHGIVARSGGSVNVYSEIGRGTSFKVYLPRAEGAEMSDAGITPPVAQPHIGTQTVLLVEDAVGLRELTEKLLKRLGYTVLIAANADEALRLFDHNPGIDVLLTDVVMPGGSGPELGRRLVEQRPALKVVYMSGYTEETIVHHGVLNPGIAFLHKPFTSDTLGRKLREVLDGIAVV